MSRIQRTTNSKYLNRDAMIRAQNFLFNKSGKKYKPICEQLFKNGLEPYAIIMVITENLYVRLRAPLNSMPSGDKICLARRIRDNIMDIRKHIVRSAEIDSLSLQEAKCASATLHELTSNLDLMCGLDYISTSLFSEIYKYITQIDMAIGLWFKTINKRAELSKHQPS